MLHPQTPFFNLSEEELLVDGAASLGIILSKSQINQFLEYSGFLRQWSRKVNLTKIVDPAEIAVKHFLDSLLYFKGFSPKPGLKLLDIGSGAGFPGVPLKIAEPHIEVTLMEAKEKRALFLRLLCGKLKLKGIVCTNCRAEEAGNKPNYRGAYDVVVSRASVPLPGLAELGLPFLRPGGRLVVSTGRENKSSLEQLRKALDKRGIKHFQEIRAPLPHSNILRTLVVLQKE